MGSSSASSVSVSVSSFLVLLSSIPLAFRPSNVVTGSSFFTETPTPTHSLQPSSRLSNERNGRTNADVNLTVHGVMFVVIHFFLQCSNEGRFFAFCRCQLYCQTADSSNRPKAILLPNAIPTVKPTIKYSRFGSYRIQTMIKTSYNQEKIQG